MSPAEIKRLRDELGLTQAQFAQLFGVHPLTISRWERPGGGLEPSAYQVALMDSFARAKTRKPDIGEVVAGLMVGAGIGVALYHLLEAAFASSPRRKRSSRRRR